PGTPWLPGDAAEGGSNGVAVVEGGRIAPPLPKRVLEVPDDGPAQLQLDVVPRRGPAVARVDEDGLRIAAVPFVVTPTMAKVDPAGERHVAVGMRGAPDDHELLMVAAAPSDAFVQQHLAARLVHHLAQEDVLLLAELLLVGGGAPHQSPHVHAVAGQAGHGPADLLPGP